MFLSWALVLLFITGISAIPLLMSLTTSIKLVDDTNITNISPTINHAVAVDYHYQRGEFYFSEILGTGSIKRGWLRPTGSSLKNPIVIATVTQSDGLAVDWVNDNLYWTDIGTHKVEMSTLDGLYRRTLFDSSQGVEKPRAIVIDPSEGLIFWSDWGDRPRIDSAGLDGGEKQTVVTTSLVWPNGLTLDLNSKKVYILDGSLSTMSSCKYDGSNLNVIKRSKDILQQAFALTFHENKLYWSSWRHHTLFSMDVSSGNTQSIYKRTGAMVVERIMGIKTIDSRLQKPISTNPCKTAGCSHRCLVSRNFSASCICPFGFKLDSDKKTCLEEGYLVTSWRTTIHRYNLLGSDEEILIDNTAAVIAIDYHLNKNFIFWSDIEEHRIYRAPLTQLNNKTVILVAEHCDGLAVDWVHDVIYWTDTFHNTLEVAELDGTKRTTLFSENMEEPRDIVVDPHSRFIFWSDWGTSAKIERAVLDGSERQTIVSDDVIWPNGIALDLKQKKVYWTDGKLSSITSCEYNGFNKKVLINSVLISAQPFALTLFQDKLYWTDWKTQSLLKNNKENIDINGISRIANYSRTITARPNGVVAVHSYLQPVGENSCMNIKCKDICLGSANSSQGHCMGELLEDPAIDVRIAVPAELTSVPYHDSIMLTLSGKVSTLAVISIKCIKRNGCSEDKHCSEGKEELKVFTNQNTFNITGLLPATVYDIDFKSPEHNEIIQLVTKIPELPEIPKITSVKVQDKLVKIKWDPVDSCIPGFDSYHYTVLKSTPIPVVALEGNTTNTEISLENLESGMNFSIRIYTLSADYYSSTSFIMPDEPKIDDSCRQGILLCDGKVDCLDGSNENKTLCAGLESVTVYIKNGSSVFFRCEVSNITIKQLDKFVGNYSLLGSNFTEEFEVAAEPCIMWPESYCFNLSGLIANKVYNFSISTALKDKSVGNHIEVSALTKEEASGPPRDIKVVNYSPNSVLIEWKHPNQSNGIIKSYIINIHEMETFEEGNCCQSFPIFESPIMDKGTGVYIHEFAGFYPASTYAISIAAKNIYVGTSATIEVNTSPPPMDIMREPNVHVSSLPGLSWKPRKPSVTDLPHYHTLIKSYLLLLLPVKGDQETTSDLGSLQSILESNIGSGFKVLWQSITNDEEAFKKPITVRDLALRREYQLAWVQVSQFKDAYGIDYILSNHFTAV